MSAILAQTKKMYKKVILIELLCFTALTLALFCFAMNEAVSFVFGVLSGFLPQVFLIYFVFFYQKTAQSRKTTVLYQGEALKFAMTVILMIVFFIAVKSISYVFFLVGFIFALLLNNALPMYLIKKNSKQQNVFN